MIEIIPLKKPISAEISAPPSKAHSLRAFFIAGLAEGKSILKNPLLAEDQMHALKALKEFGIKSEIKKDKVIIIGTGGRLQLPKEIINVGNSGVTARFLASFASLAPKGKIVIDGGKRMREGRPIQDLIGALNQVGVKIKSIYGNGCLPIEIEGGTFEGGKAELKGEISSQYFSSILISAPYAKKDTSIKCLGEMSSRPYIDITLQMMADFGVLTKHSQYKKFFVKTPQKYHSRNLTLEGDWTNVSYFLAATAICSGRIKVKNLRLDSVQGDKIFADLLKKMGCQLIKKQNQVELISKGNLKSIKRIDMNSYPDLAPTLAVISAFAQGQTEIYHIAHLRFKECDRIKALVKELKKIGVEVKERKDGLVIKPNKDNLHGGVIDCYNDHRMAMAFSIAGLKIPGIIIKNEKCVKKSFVDFYQVFKKIGGNYKFLAP